jgi:hypothetical protein
MTGLIVLAIGPGSAARNTTFMSLLQPKIHPGCAIHAKQITIRGDDMVGKVQD